MKISEKEIRLRKKQNEWNKRHFLKIGHSHMSSWHRFNRNISLSPIALRIRKVPSLHFFSSPASTQSTSVQWPDDTWRRCLRVAAFLILGLSNPVRLNNEEPLIRTSSCAARFSGWAAVTVSEGSLYRYIYEGRRIAFTETSKHQLTWQPIIESREKALIIKIHTYIWILKILPLHIDRKR